MDYIYEPDSSFDFSKLSLGQPQPLQGGSFFTKTLFDTKDIFIQLPKCTTKQGIVQTERKYYLDLLYETISNSVLSEWFENLESTFQKLIFQKRDMWFNNNIELNDIESAFTSSTRLYKSGKQFLVRAYMPRSQISKSIHCNIYDESEKILSINDVDCEKTIIPLVKIDGIRFSAKSFQLEYNVVQIMVLNEKEEIEQCLIKRNNKQSIPTTQNKEITFTHHMKEDVDCLTLLKDDDIHEKKQDIQSKTNYIKNDTNESKSNECNYLEPLDDKITTKKPELYTPDLGKMLVIEDTEDNNGENTVINIKDNKQEKEHIINNDLDKSKSTAIEKEKPNALEKSIVFDDKKKRQSQNNKNIQDLEIVTFDIDDIKDTIKLKKPNEVYYELYKNAKEKAKLAKKTAIEAYLEAKNIKTKYMLDDLDESDDEELF